MPEKPIISPISIDLGAKNTGVYFAHYQEGSSIENIEKEGKVYLLEKDKYTLLMENRTAARHQRRGYDRCQMVKRLFKLIWEKHFHLEWNKDVQQATSFLLNRRGFTFLTEEYDTEKLSRFPKEAYKLLPDELKENVACTDVEYDFSVKLKEWTNEGETKVKEIFEALIKEPKRITKRQVLIGRTKKLREYCEIRKKREKISDEKRKVLSRLSKWIWNEWQQNGVQGLDENFVAKNKSDDSEVEWTFPGHFDLIIYLNNQSRDIACQILDSLPGTASEEKELKTCVWNFKTEKFDLEKAGLGFDQPDNSGDSASQGQQKEWLKTHLHHLAFALHKTLHELESGGRHRSKYFEEVKKVLENPNHTHDYLKNFCRKLQSGCYPDLDKVNFANLIGHISNLELKPLRKYFNDKSHRNSDYWDETRLNELFDRWILREWRVDTGKDKEKADGKRGDYKNLQECWNDYKKTNPNTVIDFWLKTNPFFTIPPYQDNNNRRPPKCQSLILNPEFLNRKYPEWQDWLGELRKLPTVGEYLGNFVCQLRSLKGGGKSTYFSDKETEPKKKNGKPKSPKELKAGNQERRPLEALDARILQFIFDRVKADDPLKLNEIYSQAKKWRQEQSTEKEKQDAKCKLEIAIGESGLPNGLKTNRDYDNKGLLQEKTFLHLVCKYYKQRQRAKDGRLFIHPEYRYVKGRGYENTGRFDDRNCLLTYCNHKPRQKKYQSFHDIAGVFQVSLEELKEIIGSTDDSEVIKWLKSFKAERSSLEGICERAAKAQKEHRGFLKENMRKAVSAHSPGADDRELRNLDQNIKALSHELAKSLFGQRIQQDDPRAQKFCSVFSFAQIHNIAFKDRSGNSNTCAVCGADNAHRMQMTENTGSKEGSAKAQRLPAIPTRLIDGAVMRMARITGGAIAEEKWKKIEKSLKQEKKVRVPIITESNRFEFEPSLKEIKGKSLKDTDKLSREKGQEQLATNKDERIKEASLGICPYTGKNLPENRGDKDHIIPRSSKRGTLNDEANLIWASDTGNKKIKKDKEFSLRDLKKAYKQKQFGAKDDQEIKQWIIEQIGDGEGENFSFGKYRSFTNLNQDQQKAFRHALFLKGEPLREKIINAINNRTRMLVNGTQRYFAEAIANSLNKKARTIGKQSLLSFDFFGVEAQSNTRGDGIKDLRNEYEKTGLIGQEYAKKEGQKQKPYSHLIDAQLAFAITACAHKNAGGLRLTICDSLNLWPLDKDTGEIFEKTIFGSIQVKPDEMQPLEELQRRKVYTVETHHRKIITENRKPSINYQIHRDSICKESFFPILKFKDDKYKKGFDQSNCADFKADQFSLLLENSFVRQTSSNAHYEVWNILKKDCQQFLMKIGSVGANSQERKIAKILDNLTYQTIKKPLEKVLDTSRLKNKPPQTVGDALACWPECIKEKDFHKDSVILPAYYEWMKLHRHLQEADKEKTFYEFVKNCSLFKNTQSTSDHNKVRKVFSLPVQISIGNIRLQRKSWDKTQVIQIVAEESLAKYGYDGKGRPHTIISKNSVPKKHYTGIPDNWNLEPLEWKRVPVEKITLRTPDIEVKDAKIKNKDAGRCMARLKVSSIKDLSLPQDKRDWKGKVICHESEEEMKKAQDRDKKDNHHCLSSQFKWFDTPFTLQNDRREVEIETSPDGKVITFTISKSSKVKSWLSA